MPALSDDPEFQELLNRCTTFNNFIEGLMARMTAAEEELVALKPLTDAVAKIEAVLGVTKP